MASPFLASADGADCQASAHRQRVGHAATMIERSGDGRARLIDPVPGVAYALPVG